VTKLRRVELRLLAQTKKPGTRPGFFVSLIRP
jgi:hypothetical protein